MFVRIASALLVGVLLTACGDDDNPQPEPADTEAERIARGQYLVDHVAACGDCHTPRNAMGAPIMDEYLGGVECFVLLPNGNCLHTRNLTNDATGLMNRTNAEIKQMFLDGIRPDATGDVALFPVMPYYSYHNMTQADADAIVAYLRSVPAVEHEIPRRDVEFDIPMPAVPVDVDAIPLPMDDYTDADAAMRGRYLATQAGVCLECHTPHVMGDPLVLDYDAFFQGGESFDIGLPVVPVSKNLTSDIDTGLGEWTHEEIVTVLKEGTDKAGDGVCPPMPVGPMGAYGGLTDDDASDIAHYIKSLPPAVNLVADMCIFPPM